MSQTLNLSLVNNTDNHDITIIKAPSENPSEEIVKNFEDTVTVCSNNITKKQETLTPAEEVKNGQYTAGSNNSEFNPLTGKTENDRSINPWLPAKDKYTMEGLNSEYANNGDKNPDFFIPMIFNMPAQMNEPYVGLTSAEIDSLGQGSAEQNENISKLIYKEALLK